jgi:predicted DNA-binding transcriptional regulator AlpA
MISIRGVLERVPISRSTLERKVKEGTFPKMYSIAPMRVGFFLDEVLQWQADLARISHSVEAHRGANQRKFFCEKDFGMIQGTPRCRQSVAQNSLILEGWKAVLWKRPLMAAL